jgi:mRNA interferase YafQ
VRHPEYTGQFKRDLKLAKKRGKDMDKIKQPIRLLIDANPLPKRYLDRRSYGFHNDNPSSFSHD